MTKIKAEQKKDISSKKTRLKSKPLLFIAFGALVILYFVMGAAYQNIFFPATTVNGVNVSGLTPAQAREAVDAAAGEYILTLIEDDGTEQITGSSIGLCTMDDGTLQSLLDGQNIFTWGFECFSAKECSLGASYDEEKLLSVINSLSCMDESGWTAPENAYISYEKDTGYQIVPEVQGTAILPDKLTEAVSEAVSRLDDTLFLREAGVYKLPRITSEDSALQDQLALLQSYSEMTVTYQFGEQTEVLDGSMISEWTSVSRSGKRTIDRDAVAQYVKELASKYNTAYSAKTLETSYGETVTIKNGYYGWLIDKTAETESLMAILREGKSTTREPVYLMEAASHDGPDYGDTYVEINLTAQHLFFYKDGELVIESDFVSGNPARGNDTPSGAYSLTYKERNATLRGQNYATPVSYWMPFNGNIGMHDSSWRSTYGGSIYKTNGSHGCINLPPSVAATIYENIEKGMPVLCYRLSGTEQSHATNLSGNKVSTPAAPEPEPQIPLPPEDGTISPDAGVLPEGTVSPDAGIIPDAGITAPEGQAVPDGGIAPDAGIIMPEGGIVPDAGNVLPEG